MNTEKTQALDKILTNLDKGYITKDNAKEQIVSLVNSIK